MKEIKTYEEILGNRDVDAQPEILEMDNIKFDIVRGGEIQNLSFTDLASSEKQTVLNECSPDELKRICLILADRVRDFRHPYILKQYVPSKHVNIIFRINLEEKVYFALYYNDLFKRNECLVYNDVPKSNFENVVDKNYSDTQSIGSPVDVSNLHFDIPKINKIFEFCKENEIYAEDFFDAFFEYFKNNVDYGKIKSWITEIIEPQNPRPLECVRYGR